jgi:hypothetical protein
MTAGQPQLILGMVWRLGFDHLRPFVTSLQRTSFQGELCLFVDEAETELIRQLAVHRVLVIPTPMRQDTARFSVHCVRILFYQALLREVPHYSQIMLTDVRDVIFQRDPFEFSLEATLHCVLEERSQTLSSCPHNSAWIRSFYGEGGLAAIGHNPISCNGTVFGTHTGISAYLDLMAEELSAPHNPAPRTFGIDQAIHNHLLWSGRLPDARLHENRQGPVMTMAYMDASQIQRSPQGEVVNDDGRAVHVLHQYDRHPALSALLRERFS